MKTLTAETGNIGFNAFGNLLFFKDKMGVSIPSTQQFFLALMEEIAGKVSQRIYFEFTKFYGKKLYKKHNISVSQKTVREKFFFKKEMVIFAFPSKFFY